MRAVTACVFFFASHYRLRVPSLLPITTACAGRCRFRVFSLVCLSYRAFPSACFLRHRLSVAGTLPRLSRCCYVGPCCTPSRWRDAPPVAGHITRAMLSSYPAISLVGCPPCCRPSRWHEFFPVSELLVCCRACVSPILPSGLISHYAALLFCSVIFYRAAMIAVRSCVLLSASAGLATFAYFGGYCRQLRLRALLPRLTCFNASSLCCGRSPAGETHERLEFPLLWPSLSRWALVMAASAIFLHGVDHHRVHDFFYGALPCRVPPPGALPRFSRG